MKILIVDDDTELLEELKEILSSSGHEAFVVCKGRSTLESVRALKPDLILLDLKLRDISGFQVADEIRNDPDTNNIPIIAMTGDYTANENSYLMDIYSIADILFKPLDPDRLLKAVTGKGIRR